MWVVLSDLGQLVSAVVASLACALAARRSTGRQRRAWALLAGASASWSAAIMVWSWYEVGLGQEVPFPSPADVGFLLFPVAGVFALVQWLTYPRSNRLAWALDVLDSLIVVNSLLVLAWLTTLGAVVERGGSGLPFALSLVYTLADLALVTLAFLALVRAAPGAKGPFALLAGGLFLIATADGRYAVLVSRGEYTSASLPALGWILGFACLALAASRASAEVDGATVGSAPQTGSSSVLALALPWLPLLVAVPAVGIDVLVSPTLPVAAIVTAICFAPLVVGRQVLAAIENRRLFLALQQAHDGLQYQALHDSLTGLPNRALFNDRLRQAMLQPGEGLSLLFCDLDDFKQVNDLHGHDVGDAVLRVVANRLREGLREADTVARLGGDEFAILLVAGSDPSLVTERLIARVHEPMDVEGRRIRVSMSVGVARHDRDGTAGADRRGEGRLGEGRRRDEVASPLTVEEAETKTKDIARDLLVRADMAMYAAKDAGKGRAVTDEWSGRS